MDGDCPVPVPLLRDAMPMQPALIHEHRQWTAPCEQLLDAVPVVPASPETDNDADELVQVSHAPGTVRTRRKRWYRSWVGFGPLTICNSSPFQDISVCVVKHLLQHRIGEQKLEIFNRFHWLCCDVAAAVPNVSFARHDSPRFPAFEQARLFVNHRILPLSLEWARLRWASSIGVVSATPPGPWRTFNMAPRGAAGANPCDSLRRTWRKQTVGRQ